MLPEVSILACCLKYSVCVFTSNDLPHSDLERERFARVESTAERKVSMAVYNSHVTNKHVRGVHNILLLVEKTTQFAIFNLL